MAWTQSLSNGSGSPNTFPWLAQYRRVPPISRGRKANQPVSFGDVFGKRYVLAGRQVQVNATPLIGWFLRPMTVSTNCTSRRLGRHLVTLAAFLVAAAPLVCAAQESSSATPDELIRQGIEAYKKKDYPSAKSALSEALRHDLVGSVAAMLADVEMRLKQYRDAAEHWTMYLNGLSSDQEGERADVKAQLEICLKHVGSAKVTVTPADASVTVDGQPAKLRPTGGELWLEPGMHTIEAKSKGGTAAQTLVEIRAGSRLDVAMKAPEPPPAPVVPVASPQPQILAPPPPESKGVETKTLVLIGGGILTLAGATVSGVYWYKNSEAYDEVQSLREQVDGETKDPRLIELGSACVSSSPPKSCAALKAKNDEVSRTSSISNYALVATGVVGVATIATYLLWPESHKQTSTQTSWSVVPWWGEASQGVTATVRF